MLRRTLIVGITVALCASAPATYSSATKTIRGTARADVLRGTAAADAIYALAGNDRIFGRGGRNRIYPGAGVDRVEEGGYYTVGGSVPIGADRTFASNTRTSSGDATMSIRGTFDAAGNVSGTFQGHVSLDDQGTHYECDSGTVQWSGGRQ